MEDHTQHPTQFTTEAIAQRLALIRKERGLTQHQMAQRLGVTQPIISDYERGELRLHGELIVKMTHILKISADEWLGLESTERKNLSLKNQRLWRRVQQIEQFPRCDQEALLRTIDAFLAKIPVKSGHQSAESLAADS